MGFEMRKYEAGAGYFAHLKIWTPPPSERTGWVSPSCSNF